MVNSISLTKERDGFYTENSEEDCQKYKKKE